MIDLLDLKISGEVGMRNLRYFQLHGMFRLLLENPSEPSEPSRGPFQPIRTATSTGQAIDLIGQPNFKFHSAGLVFLHDSVETRDCPRVGEESGGVVHGSRIEILPGASV